MNPGSEAADQVLRLSIQGFRVAVRVTGKAARSVALLLTRALAQKGHEAGKERFAAMLRTGGEIKTFDVPEELLRTFSREAGPYGIRYCVLREETPGQEASARILTRAEDAPKIRRILDRCLSAREEQPVSQEPALSPLPCVSRESQEPDPFSAGTASGVRSGQSSVYTGKTESVRAARSARPSVREQLRRNAARAERQAPPRLRRRSRLQAQPFQGGTPS